MSTTEEHKEEISKIREFYGSWNSDAILFFTRLNDEDHKAGRINDMVWSQRRMAFYALRDSYFIAEQDIEAKGKKG